MRFQLFGKKKNDDAALITKDRGKVYDVSPAAKKKGPSVVSKNRPRARGRSASSKKSRRASSKVSSDRYATSSFRERPCGDNGEMNGIPVIDRIPTAIGYHSEGSEDEWLEEKSRCSRYTTPEDEPDEMIMSDDEEECGADKYSVGKNSMTKQQDGIERLWSDETFDSRASKRIDRMWNQYDEKKRIDSYYGDDDLEEARHDPIYESPRKVKESIFVRVVPPSNPPVDDEPTMDTVPSVNDEAPVAEKSGHPFIHDAENDQELKAVKLDEPQPKLEQLPEQKSEQAPKRKPKQKPELPADHKEQTSSAKVLETLAKSSQGSLSQSRRQTTRDAASIKIDSAASKQLDAMASMDGNDSSSGDSDPLVTLAATDVLVKEIETKLKALKATAAKEKKAVKKMQREHKRSLSRGRSAERTKSVDSKKNKSKERKRSKSANGDAKGKPRSQLDSKKKRITKEKPATPPGIKSFFNGFTVMLFRKSEETKQAWNEQEKPDKANAADGALTREQSALSVTSEPKQEENLVNLMKDRHPETELKTSSDEKDGSTKGNSQLWKLRRRGVLDDSANTSEQDHAIIGMQQAEVQEQLSMNLSDPPEHDEYSGGNFTPPVQQRPALVQCFKFYGCAGAADNVDDAIKAVDNYRDAVIACCGSPTASMDQGLAQTPRPSVEVVLEEIDRSQHSAVPSEDKGYRRGQFGSTNPAPEAPADVKPKQPVQTDRSQQTVEEKYGLTNPAPKAPALVKLKKPAKVLNVTEMNLHLDGDSNGGEEEDHQAPSASFNKNRSAGRGGVSVTSIHVPTKKVQRQVDEDEDDAEDLEDAEEEEDAENQHEPQKGSRLSRFLRSLTLRRET